MRAGTAEFRSLTQHCDNARDTAHSQETSCGWAEKPAKTAGLSEMLSVGPHPGTAFAARLRGQPPKTPSPASGLHLQQVRTSLSGDGSRHGERTRPATNAYRWQSPQDQRCPAGPSSQTQGSREEAMLPQRQPHRATNWGQAGTNQGQRWLGEQESTLSPSQPDREEEQRES